MNEFLANCPICLEDKVFRAPDDFYSSRDSLSSTDCGFGGCVTRERALATVVRRLYPGIALQRARIHESSPVARGLSAWMRINCPRYVRTGFFPQDPTGFMVGEIRNENLEAQSFADEMFDLVIHLDVLEHVFDPFKALREIYRTLVKGGHCIFSVPTDYDRFSSTQVAFQRGNSVEIVGKPEYHFNPHDSQGSLVSWRYGYDFPLLISRQTSFDTEVCRFQSRRAAATGLMTEIYILSK